MKRTFFLAFFLLASMILLSQSFDQIKVWTIKFGREAGDIYVIKKIDDNLWYFRSETDSIMFGEGVWTETENLATYAGDAQVDSSLILGDKKGQPTPGALKNDKVLRTSSVYDGVEWMDLTDNDYPGSIYVIRDGVDIYVRSNLSNTKDVVIRMYKEAIHNLEMSFYQTFIIDPTAGNSVASYTSGTLIHSVSDDIAPPVMNNIQAGLGADHGLYVPQIESSTHNKTTADLGSIWTYGGTNYYLVEISTIYLTFLPIAKTYLGYWVLDIGIGGTLTWVSGGTNHESIVSSGTETYPVKNPVSKNHKLQYLINGKTPLAADEESYANFIDIVESYDVIDPRTLHIPTPLETAMDWTDGDTWFTLSNTYRFTDNGACIIYQTIHYETDANVRWILGITSDKLNIGAYDDVLVYMPKVDTVHYGTGAHSVWDLKVIDTLTNAPGGSVMYIYTENAERVANYPDRTVEFLKNDGEKSDVGFAFGYNSIYPGSDSVFRAVNDSVAWAFGSGGKNYPVVAFNTGNIDDTTFQIIAYRQYFDPGRFEHPTAVYWNRQSNFDFMYIDYHSTVTSDTLPMPAWMWGKLIEVVERETLTLNSGLIVPETGLIVSTTGGYGTATLKLSNAVKSYTNAFDLIKLPRSLPPPNIQRDDIYRDTVGNLLSMGQYYCDTVLKYVAQEPPYQNNQYLTLGDDAATEFLSWPAPLSLGTTGSVCFWAKGVLGKSVMPFGANSATGANDLVGLYNGNFYYGDDNEAKNVASALDGSWHWYCVTRNGTSLKFYKDGYNQVGAEQTLGTSGSCSPVNVGKFYTGGFLTEGSMDEVCAYSKVLSETEMDNLYADGTPGNADDYDPEDVSGAALIHYLNMEQANAASITDIATDEGLSNTNVENGDLHQY